MIHIKLLPTETDTPVYQILLEKATSAYSFKDEPIWP